MAQQPSLDHDLLDPLRDEDRIGLVSELVLRLDPLEDVFDVWVLLKDLSRADGKGGVVVEKPQQFIMPLLQPPDAVDRRTVQVQLQPRRHGQVIRPGRERLPARHVQFLHLPSEVVAHLERAHLLRKIPQISGLQLA